MSENYDDDGFGDYEETTVDPGSSIVTVTVFICIGCYCILPLLIVIADIYDKVKAKKENRSKSAVAVEEVRGEGYTAWEESAESEQPVTKQLAKRLEAINKSMEKKLEAEEVSVSSRHSAASSFVSSILENTATSRASRGRRRHAMERRLRKHQETDKQSYVGHGGHSIASIEKSWMGGVEDRTLNGVTDDPTAFPHQPLQGIRSCLHLNFERLLTIAEWDYETKEIWKLAFPYLIQTVLGVISETIRLSIIGKLSGTDALTAYVIVNTFIGITDGFLYGFVSSAATLVSQTLGTGNTKLSGQYVQLSLLFYTLLSIPGMLLWYFLIDDLMELLGFEQRVVQLGVTYTGYAVFTFLFEGINGVPHALLDIDGHEIYSTVVTLVGEFATTGAIALANFTYGPGLEGVGYIDLASSILFLALNLVIIAYLGWFRKFYDGLFNSFALKNKAAVKLMMKTSITLALSSILAYSEWELLTIFATILGPAEVVAWGLLGTIWESLSYITEAVADAGEVRCAYLLGASQPFQGRLSAYKTVFFGVLSSVFVTSILFICGKDLPRWLTNDPTLINMITELIPLFGLGNIALSFGTVSWTLIGAQGRYRLATVVGFAGSWLVTIPLSAIFSIAVNMDLQGQTAAVVLGYMASGTVNSFLLLRSDWSALSDKVVSDNGGSSDSSESSSEDDEG